MAERQQPDRSERLRWPLYRVDPTQSPRGGHGFPLPFHTTVQGWLLSRNGKAVKYPIRIIRPFDVLQPAQIIAVGLVDLFGFGGT